MTNISNETNPLDNDREDKQLSSSIDNHSQHVRLRSFVDRYGVEESDQTARNQIKHFFKKQISTLSFLCCLNAFLEKIPLLRCLKEYSLRKYLFGDIISGITVAIMHIPQGMAYGVLTTLPPIHGNTKNEMKSFVFKIDFHIGLYVSFFPVIIYMIFGTCPHLSLGSLLNSIKNA